MIYVKDAPVCQSHGPESRKAASSRKMLYHVNAGKIVNSKKKHNIEQMDGQVCTVVKSNALAELMNRASKIHWKNLS